MFKKRTSSQKLDRGLTLSSELTSAVFGGVGGGLFFMSNKTSTTYIKHVSFMENCGKPRQTGETLHTFIFEIFISNSFCVREDSFCSSMNKFMMCKGFGIF